jgi:hypothetical protein
MSGKSFSREFKLAGLGQIGAGETIARVASLSSSRMGLHAPGQNLQLRRSQFRSGVTMKAAATVEMPR